ncbi:MAG: imidazole glycerol phosphate synthase subunit HisH [Planctomycetales bacterium]|nr:imidazole glycerol phosphate synthase subunit HisH [Planctomycetales bacterium]
MITIVDYQMGNLRSVQKGFERVGHEATITSDAEVIRQADQVVLPGVGAFGDAMNELTRRDLVEPIREFIDSGRPFLGICLGLQLLFETGYEGGTHRGLGILPGKVVRFELPAAMKVPHMGWNQIQIRRPAPILQQIPNEADVYFVHSYYVVPDEPEVIATETEYGFPFCSMIWRDNVFATQFHPEKSQKIGLAILAGFAQLGQHVA